MHVHEGVVDVEMDVPLVGADVLVCVIYDRRPDETHDDVHRRAVDYLVRRRGDDAHLGRRRGTTGWDVARVGGVRRSGR